MSIASVAFVLSLFSAPASAGIVCEVGMLGELTVCCAAGCGAFGVGCQTGTGNYQVSSDTALGSTCEDMPGQVDGLEPTTGGSDTTVATTDEPGECDPGESLEHVPAMASYMRDGFQSQAKLTRAFSDDHAGASLDAAIESMSGEVDSAATLLDQARYPEAIAKLQEAVAHLNDAKDAGADAGFLVEEATNLAFISAVSILDEARALGVSEEDLSAGWATYDEATQALDDGEPIDTTLGILAITAGFGSGTRQTTTKTSSKPELL